MEPLGQNFLTKDYEVAKVHLRETLNDAVRHIKHLEAFQIKVETVGVDRCHEHMRRLDMIESKINNGYGKSLFKMNIGQWVVIIAVVCGVVASWATQKANTDNAMVVLTKIEAKLEVIVEKQKDNSERISRIEGKLP